MAGRECPDDYEEHSNACYYFGSYSSHTAAQQSCETVDARLVDIDSVNAKFVKERVHFIGGNDHWIGSYIAGNRKTKKKGKTCPMLRGQTAGNRGAYAQVDCNSAYPYICQKYGENRGVQGLPGFNPDGEFEIPVSLSKPEVTTAVAEATGSNNSLVAVVSCIVILIVLAIVTRIMCNRRSAKKEKKEKNIQLLQQQQQKTHHENPFISDKSDSNTLNSIAKIPRSNASIKPFSLPEPRLSLEPSAPIFEQQPIDDIYENTRGRYDECHQEDETSYKSRGHHTDGSVYYQSRSRRTPSIERHLHGRHEHDSPPPSPFEPRSQRRRGRSRSRRRSISAIEYATDLATTRYSVSSRDTSEDSYVSDSAFSTATETTFRSYSEGRRRHRSHSYGHESAGSIYYPEHKRHHRGRGRRRRRHREHQRIEPRSRYEQYAAKRPPSAALDVLERKIDSEKFRHQQSYLKRSKLDTAVQEIRQNEYSRKAETLKPAYFPQIFTTWSREDLRISDDIKKSKTPSQPLYPRSLPKSHVRVNRHIHDFEKPSQNLSNNTKSQSQDSDHVYESLDNVKSSRDRQTKKKRNKRLQAIPLQTPKTNAIPDSSLSRDFRRSSARSRASMRNRGLPATPQS